MSGWPQLTGNSNVFRQSYVSGFLDVSGGTVLRNDVSMNGNISVGQTLYTVGGINQTGTSLPVAGTIPNDGTVAGRLFVLNDSSLNGQLFVGGDVSMNGNLYNFGRTIHQGDVSMNSRLYVNEGINILNSRNLNLIQQPGGSTSTIQWMNSAEVALGLIYASTSSLALNFNVQPTLTNGFRFISSGEEKASISNAGLLSCAGVTYNYSTLPTFTSGQIGYIVNPVVNTSGITVTATKQTIWTFTNLPIGVYIITGNGLLYGLSSSRTDILFTATGATYMSGNATYEIGGTSSDEKNPVIFSQTVKVTSSTNSIYAEIQGASGTIYGTWNSGSKISATRIA